MEGRKTGYGFLSIRNYLLIFSVLATLVPSLGMGWLLNSMMHGAVTEKIEQRLLDSAGIIDREISLWFKERRYDLRVFSNSFVIAENFSTYLRSKKDPAPPKNGEPAHIKNLVTYLTSVQRQFVYSTRLLIFDGAGNIVAASAREEEERPVTFPENVPEQIEKFGYFRGEVFFEGPDAAPMILIGIPLFSEKRKKDMGFLAVEIRLRALLPILRNSLLKIKTDIPVTGSLVRLADGRRFLTLGETGGLVLPETVAEATRRLFSAAAEIQEFTDRRGTRVVGIATPLEELGWGLIITEKYDDVYAKLIRSRNRNIVIVLAFTLLISLAAYLFSKRIITPLRNLADGALKVAGGDLNVQLPVYAKDELGLTTEVFNEMVVELQQSHNKLKELATTDSLTLLANRKRIMEVLHRHFERYKRYASPFSILMIDVDHFKKINDSHGHLAGDAVLKQLAEILQKTLRNVDYPGRYGGEEFLVVLPETGGEEAGHSAERIREAVRSTLFHYEKQALKLSVSIGVAAIRDQDEDENSLVRRADDALYRAKADGRDRVVLLDDDRTDEAPASSLRANQE